ncbi:MAG: cell division protein FtsZ [Thaumarchaeota archaeon]|nr:cell division protein FtsZ [Nitrososphaerota archaeon]
MELNIMKPVLIIGIGRAGSEIAMNIKNQMDSNYLLVSNDEKDFKNISNSIKINSNGIINPSANVIRSCTYKIKDKFKDKISEYQTIIIITNLAGNNGNGISPVLARICRQENKNLISLIIMPFKFEKDKLFMSSVSLKHLQRASNCMMVFDNNALLDSNPNLTKLECNRISINTMSSIIHLLKSPNLSKKINLITTSGITEDLEKSLGDSIKMLYKNVSPENVDKTILHILLSDDHTTIGCINHIANIVENIYMNENVVSVSYTKSIKKPKIILVASLNDHSRMNFNDPLTIIPINNEIDYEEPDCEINYNLSLQQLE